MGEEIAISLRNVSKCYKQYHRPVDRLKEILLPDQKASEEFWALRDINFDISKGQTVGIIGRNGSGKSTLLQIIAGTLTPTTGEVSVKGRVSALLELGSGFNPEFTGRQNVFFNGRLLGLSQQEIENKFDEIAGFADIGDFIDRPVKTYSSGMFVRLAFAVAVNVDPEILIVDEALAVGDVVFQHRCMRKMRTLMDSGVTTLFVSHDSGAVKTLCNSAVMIHDGQIYTTGLPNDVIIRYLKLVTDLELGLSQVELESQLEEQKVQEQTTGDNVAEDIAAKSVTASKSSVKQSSVKQSSAKLKRRGSGKAQIEEIKLLNSLGEDVGVSPVFGFNEEVTLVVNVKAYESLQSCILGFYVCDKNGNEVIGSNTFEENVRIENLDAGETLEVSFTFNLPLRANSYSLTVAGSENYETLTFDWIDNAMVFQVLPPETGKRVHALVDLPMVVKARKASLPRVEYTKI
ncbi:ABC transporter ATP-binding protein [Mastigocoleus testarum]|uniref:ABC transporter ATP-binding protein n=1 Tax=Mastigocoleus testarum BC008 TaxID=371196 RepID=A0A0V7ZSA6_9CYAN|nr:ABC transporter ATP-binding protein [Mastigocoleus testarum]KST67354.1 ABC transporter ATP-binding protein [Mastigocoleus testarum BC008]